MNNRRTILRLLLLGLLAVGAHALLTFRGGDSHRLVPRTQLVAPGAALRRVVVERADSPALVLEVGENGSWRISSPYAADANDEEVKRLVDAITFAPIESVRTETELARDGRTRDSYGLGSHDARLKVTLATDGGETTVSFGSPTPSGDGVFVAVSDSASVFTVSSNVLARSAESAESYRRRTLWREDPGESSLASFDIRRGASSFLRFARSAGAWELLEPQKVTAAETPIRRLLGALGGASVRSFVWPVGASGEETAVSEALLAPYSLDVENAITVTLRYSSGRDDSVSFGRPSGSGEVYALVQGGRAIVTVDAHLRELASADQRTFTDLRLFPCAAGAVEMISIGDGPISCLLSRDPTSAWRFDAPVSAPADGEAVDALLQRVVQLKAEDRDSAGVTIALSTNAPPVAVSRQATLGDGRLEDLRSRDIVRIPPSSVKRIVVTRAGGEGVTSLAYDSQRGVWDVESSERPGVADGAALNRFLAALDPLQASSVVRLVADDEEMRHYGLDAPRMTIAVDRAEAGAVRRNIFLGNSTSAGTYATVGARDAVFIVPAAVVGALTSPLVTAAAETER